MDRPGAVMKRVALAITGISSLLACSKPEPVAVTNSTVNAAMTNLDMVAVAKKAAPKEKPKHP